MAQKQEWTASGADCCSPFSACLLSWCLPCVQYGRISHRLNKDASLKGWSFFNGNCVGYYALTCCGMQWIMQMMQRGEIRERYGLTGNGCTDCLCACCCGPCDLVQQDKEIDQREKAQLIQVQPTKADQMQYGQ